ncbi:glycosyltransferase family 4 protein [Formosa sp. A9]|uniref:glycosyltransferase family 4 protein n=1 Tax=Formosa sp. A9 TaxID=3442641 RepID=UPI003EBD3370
MPKHIALILAQPPGYSETFFRSKIKCLQDAGFTVCLYVQQASSAFDDCTVHVMPKVHSNPIRQVFAMVLVFLGLLPYLRRVLRFIQLERASGRKGSQLVKNIYTNAVLLKSDADWLHFGFATLAIQREQVAKAIGAKMAVSLRGFDVAIFPLKHPGCYKTLWQQVDKVHTISDDLLACAYRTGLSVDKPVVKITPAIALDVFTNNKYLETYLGQPIKLLTVARLHWKKGFIATLEALAILKHKGMDFEYTIVGQGDEHEAICFAIHQLGLSDRVRLLGVQTPQDVRDLMATSDVYLQYSISEGFCNAVLEAQAMGLLCVVSDAEGLAENVIHGKTGWVVPKLQPKALAATLLAVINLPRTEQQGYRERAVARVKTEFNLEQQAEEFVRFYESKCW